MTGQNGKVLFFYFILFILAPSQVRGEQFVIQQPVISVDGHTSENALRNYLGLRGGETFDSETALHEYLEEKERLLRNLRVIKKYSFDYTVQEVAAGGSLVFIAVSITDGWTFYPVPMYKYNSSAGHTFLGILYDTNIFGTLSSFKLSCELNRQMFRVETFAEDIRIGRVPWRFTGRYEYLEQAKEQEDEAEVRFNTKTLSAGIGAALPFFECLYYSFFPSFEYRFDYRFETGTPDTSLKPEGATLSYEHAAGADTVDWTVNFREGFFGELKHIVSYTPITGRWVNKLEPSVSGFAAAGPVGFSGRLSGFYWNGLERTGAGEELRGVIDNTLWGDAGAYLNTDIALRLFTIKKVMEFQPGIFFDAGFVKPFETVLTPECFEYTAGLGVLLFPLFSPGMLIRFAYGFNLKNGGGEFVFDFEGFY